MDSVNASVQWGLPFVKHFRPWDFPTPGTPQEIPGVAAFTTPLYKAIEQIESHNATSYFS